MFSRIWAEYRERLSENTVRLHRNLFGTLTFTERPKTSRNMASSEENQILAGAFHAIMDKIEADKLQIAKKWNWK